MTEHHAIIPTGVRPRDLAANDQLIYDAITTQFIAAFYPVCVKHVTTVDGVSRQVKFQAKGTQVIEPRILILSTQGLVMDLALPSANRQKNVVREDRPAKPPVRKKE